jgi:hypothetical protein
MVQVNDSSHFSETRVDVNDVEGLFISLESVHNNVLHFEYKIIYFCTYITRSLKVLDDTAEYVIFKILLYFQYLNYTASNCRTVDDMKN